jgi:lantibiotic biosynthesis protein
MAAQLSPLEDGTEFLEAATRIGRRLVDTAVWHEDRCTWLGDDVDPDGQVVHRSMAGDLYSGTSGIGWALGRLWEATGDDVLAPVAAGALRHALHRSAGDPPAGLYTGGIGAALAAVGTGAVLGDASLRSAGADLATTVAGAVAHGPPDSQVDLLGGSAGQILGLLNLADLLGDATLVEAAVHVGERLLDEARRGTLGWTWASTDAAEPPLCGLGHGASGVALAFLELEGATGDSRFGEAMRGALRYERAWFDRLQGGWPDLREMDSARVLSGARPTYPIYWCHGSAGIGLVRLRVYQRTDDSLALAEAGAAIDSATATMLRVLAREGHEPTGRANLSLCHGVGSVIELHLAAAEVTGDPEHLDHARRLGRWGMWGSDDARDFASAEPPAEIPCGVPGGGETPGLMLGLAGIATTYLRLSDPALVETPVLPWGTGSRVGGATRR